MSKKHHFRLFIFANLLSLSLALAGCSINELVDNVSESLGLSMHSTSESDKKIEIEIYEHKSKDNSDSDEADSKPVEDSDKEEAIGDDTDVSDEDISKLLLEDDERNKTYYRKAQNPDSVSISFAGDFCLTEGCSVLNYMKNHDYDPQNSFDENLFARMNDSDIFLINNEFPYSHGGSALPNKKYTFRANPDDAVLLSKMGVDIVSLANNHCYDYGPDALVDTCETLRNLNMPYIGAGENIEEASKPAYFNINGKTIALIAATQIEGYANPETKEATETSPGVLRCLDTTRLESIIADAKTKSDFVICYIHWGTERYDLIREWQKSNAQNMVNAGADLIVGAHSHCLQGIDYIDGVPVCYSLGNYLFNSNTQDTALLTLTLDTSKKEGVDIKSLQFVPCIQSGGRTVEASSEDWSRIINYEQGISYHALLDAQGFITYTEQNMNTQNGKNTSPMRDKSEDQNTATSDE